MSIFAIYALFHFPHHTLKFRFHFFSSCSNVRENTIASLKDSIAHGADMVEFDVQLSKDLIPVIYHEFEVCALVQKRKGDKEVSVTMPIKSLTLEQLQELKVKTV